MTKLSLPLFLAASFLEFGAAAAVDFENGVFFGDSLSDSGTFAPVLPEGTGRFTTNPGPVWVEILGETYGFDATPAAIENGEGGNYAQGGARVIAIPGYPNIAPTSGALSINQQVGAYLEGAGGADGDSLYSVWAGSNEVFFFAEQAALGQISAEEALGGVAQAALDLAAEVGRLQEAGAQYILVGTVPDTAQSPFGIVSGAGETLTLLTDQFNQTLFSQIVSDGTAVIPLDFNRFLSDVLADPTAFGLLNVDTPACGLTRALLCTPEDHVVEGAAEVFLFADGVHPTSAGHRLIADFATSIVEAPQGYSMLAETPVKSRELLTRALDRRLADPGRESQKFNVFGFVDYNRLEYDKGAGSPGLKANTYGFTVGGDVSFSDNWTAGGALTYHDTSSKVGGGGGKFEGSEMTLSGFGGYRFAGAGFVNAVIGIGQIDYDDVRRKVVVGSAAPSARSETKGSNVSLAFSGGYRFERPAFNHGPIGRILGQWVEIDGFEEDGGVGAASLAVDDQKRKSLLLTAGYGIRWRGDNFSPYLEATIDHDAQAKARDIDAELLGPVAMPFDEEEDGQGGTFQFSLPGFVPDKTYGTLVAGYNFWLSERFSGDVRYTGAFGSDVRSHAFLATFEARL